MAADDAARRRDEAEALAAMFGDDFFEIGPFEWILRCTDAHAELTIQLPADYPSRSPPVLLLDAPSCERGKAGELCQEFLLDFIPGEEHGATLALRFFEAFQKEQPTGREEAALAEANEEDQPVPVSAIIQLRRDAADEISASLLAAGFQKHAAQIYVHGELGVAAEIGDVGDELQISVDGVDALRDLSDWVNAQLVLGLSEWPFFGKRLLEWANAHRAASESTDGSADGVFDADVVETVGAKLTGNAAWRARLQAGETVEFRGSGNSLHPRIKSGECCRYVPVRKHEDIKEKDIVFCQIKGRYWGHMVKKKTFMGGKDEYEYTISNIHGWENGTCTLEHVYGKVVDHWK